MRSPLRFTLGIALALAMVATRARACSMCGCGDPTYRMVGEEFFGGSPWRVGFDVDHTGKDAAGDAPGTREHESETRYTASGAWTPRPWLHLMGRVPLIDRHIATDEGTAAMFGLADPELMIHAQVTPTGARHWAAIMVGVRSPWGQNDRTRDGVRVDEHLQPGSGATSLWSGVSGAFRLDRTQHVYASVLSQWNQANRHGYRYGDAVFANLAYQRDLAPRLAGVFELNARDARFDRIDGVQAENTGGSVLYVAPRAQWQMNDALVMRLGVQVPVAQRMLGDQREHANLITGITLAY